MPTEMINLRRALDARSIPWVNCSDNLDRSFPFLNLIIYRTRWEHNGHIFSVRCGLGSLGGDKGLLELTVDDELPVGSLTAVDIIKRMEENND